MWRTALPNFKGLAAIVISSAANPTGQNLKAWMNCPNKSAIACPSINPFPLICPGKYSQNTALKNHKSLFYMSISHFVF